MRHLPILFLFVLTVPETMMAQRPHPILKEFVAVHQQNGVLLKWVIAGGNQCNGIKAHRSEGGDAFDMIHNIAGICGSTDADETYSYLDTSPGVNTENTYRLEMGGQGLTQPVTVFYRYFGSSNHARLTNAADGTVRLIFSNDTKQPISVEVHDFNGRPVWRQQTRESEAVLQTEGWEEGLYVYRISGASSGPVLGRMMVGR